MRAVRVHGWGEVPVVEDVDEPVRGTDEVLVQVQAAALSHLDLTVAAGDFAMKPNLPYVGGVEASGVVLRADGLPEGTQVLVRGAGLGLKRDGTWSERVSVPVRAVTPLAEFLDPSVAATFFQPTSTAYVALHDVARLAEAEDVIVTGAAGAVGSQVVQQALLAGATVTGVVWRADQLERVPAGARALLATDDGAIAELAGSRSASLLVDTLGGGELLARARWVRPGGRAVVIGYVLGAAASIDLVSWLQDEVSLLPVNMVRNERRAKELSADLIGKLSRGELTLDVETFAADDVVKALDLLRTGGIKGRAAMTFGAA